jgi:hypothetical protein
MMITKWGDDLAFDFIILDYFFSPCGWARTRWTEAFFKTTLPMLVTSEFLKPNGSIYLPNLDCVEELLVCFENQLAEYYMWDRVREPEQNPLYGATMKCEAELLLCPDRLTNDTQMHPLKMFSKTPFIVLKRLNRSYEKRDASGAVIRRAAVVHPLRLSITPPTTPDTDKESLGSSPDSVEGSGKRRRREVEMLKESWMPAY